MLVVSVLRGPLSFALLTTPRRYGHDQGQEHYRDGDHDYDDSCSYGENHDG
jgi:hypothetical protein